MDGRKKGVLQIFVADAYGVVTTNPQTLTLPAGSAAGDLALVTASTNSSAWSLTGGTTIRSGNYGAGYPYGIFFKILTAADLLSGLSLGGNTTGAFHVVVFRNVTSAANKGATQGNAGVTNPSSPGFVKNPNHKGTVSVFITRSAPATPTLDPPQGWKVGSIVSDAVTWQTWASLLSPSTVADNTPTTWRGTTGDYYIAASVELT
jgi:hypothetical protein